MHRFTLSFLAALVLAVVCPGQALKCGVADSPSSLGYAHLHSLPHLSSNAVGGFNKTTGTKRIIPTYIHIVYEDPQDAHNISDSQIRSQILATNTHLDGALGGVNTNIGLCLAGIRRVSRASVGLSNSINNVGVGPGLNEIDLKLASRVDRSRFLNVWLVEGLFNANGQSLGGHAYFPWEVNAPGNGDLDGIVMRADQFGRVTGTVSHPYELGATFTHELGHYLGLLHPWAGGCHAQSDCERLGDCCCDTPLQLDDIVDCKRRNSCENESPDSDDGIHNYMQITVDVCRSEFTQCQSDRMNQVLSVDRAALSVCLGERCRVPKMDFLVDERVRVGPIPFSDAVRVSFGLGVAGVVEVAVFDVSGRWVLGFVEGYGVGEHDFIIAGASFGEGRGVYFLKFVVGERVVWRKLVRE